MPLGSRLALDENRITLSLKAGGFMAKVRLMVRIRLRLWLGFGLGLGLGLWFGFGFGLSLDTTEPSNSKRKGNR